MIIYDLHAHSTHSDGRATVDHLIEKAKEGGYRTGISDHLFCDGLYTEEDIIGYLDDVEGRGIPVGGEANIGEEFLLSDKQIQRFDYLIASVHAVFPPDGKFAFNKYFAMRGGFIDSWPGYDKSRASEFLELSYQQIANHFARYRIEILGHATVMPFYDDIANDSKEIIDWENGVVSMCKKYNVALEISSMWNQPFERMLTEGKKQKIKFSYGSDCHKLEDIGNLKYCLEMGEKLGLTEEDIYLPEYSRQM